MTSMNIASLFDFRDQQLLNLNVRSSLTLKSHSQCAATDMRRRLIR